MGKDRIKVNTFYIGCGFKGISEQPLGITKHFLHNVTFGGKGQYHSRHGTNKK
jgi:hypothetical protein